MKGLYGRVNPLQGRRAGAWEDTERAAGRCWVVFSPERISKGRLCQETSGLRDSTEQATVNLRAAEVKAAIYMFKINMAI